MVKTMTESDSIRFGETTSEYQVRRSARRRKTVQIGLDAGRVYVAAPTAIPDRELRDMVRRRATWILDNIRDRESLTKAQPLFVSGEKLPYLGRSVSMIVRSGDMRVPTARFDHWRFMVSIPKDVAGDERFERIRDAFIEWYSERAAERLSAGGLSSAGARGREYSSGTSADAGAVAPRMGRCARPSPSTSSCMNSRT